MKRRNVLGMLAVIVEIMILIIASRLSIFENYMEIVGAIIFCFITFTTVFCILKNEKEIKLEKEKNKKERLAKLEQEYSNYISLVNEIQTEHLKNIGNIDLEEYGISISTDKDYLLLFEKYVNWISENRIEGKPDTFIEAACLMYSLIKMPRILINKDLVRLGERQGFSIEQSNLINNSQIAFEVALRLISEPSTYYKDEAGRWIEEKHSKVNIIVPDGLIKNNTLYDRILNTIVKDFETAMNYYVIQLSNLLHLIYLNCK